MSAAAFQNLGAALHAADQFAEAETAYRKALELTPQRSSMHAYLSLILAAQGRGEEALAEALREPEETYRLWALGIVHHAMSDRAKSDAALAELTEKYADDAAYQVAEVHGARGEVDAAFTWLDRAYAQRDAGLPDTRTSPHLRGLRGDPRWGVFLKRLGHDA